MSNGGKGTPTNGLEKLGVKYGPLFSFYDYYQDSLNDIAYFADSTGKLTIVIINTDQ